MQPYSLMFCVAILGVQLAPTAAAETDRWNELSAAQKDRGCSLETVGPGIWRLRLAVPERFTPVTQRSAPPCEEGLAVMPPAGRLPFRAADVRFSVNGHGSMIELPLNASERIFGFGLKIQCP